VGSAPDPVRELIAFEVQRARRHYEQAAPGVTMLAPASQGCIRAAYRLYGGILDEVEKLDYDVFARRARVPRRRRLAVALASVCTPAGRPVPLPGNDLDPMRRPRAAVELATLTATTSGKVWPQGGPETTISGKL
jgi:15-cis-phytoene synthase